MRHWRLRGAHCIGWRGTPVASILCIGRQPLIMRALRLDTSAEVAEWSTSSPGANLDSEAGPERLREG